MKYNIDEITEDFLKENDGILVWIRWDYLILKGYAYNEDRELYDFLEKIEELKVKMAENGYIFKA